MGTARSVGDLLGQGPKCLSTEEDHSLVPMHSALRLLQMSEQPPAHCSCRAKSQCWYLSPSMQMPEAIFKDLTRAVVAKNEGAKEQLHVQQAGLPPLSGSPNSTLQHLLCSSSCMLKGSHLLQCIPDCTLEPAASFSSKLMSVQ